MNKQTESVNDTGQLFKGVKSYLRQNKKTVVIAVPATVILALFGVVTWATIINADAESRTNKGFLKAAEQGDQLAQLGAKCDHLAGDPNDPQKSGPGVPFGKLDSAAAIEACKLAIEVSPLARYHYQLGLALKKAEKDTDALHWFGKAAAQGYAPAQLQVAYTYDHGWGVAEDYAEAMKWYRKAADQGGALAQTEIGDLYERGKLVAMDYTEAMKWYRKAADQGDDHGQFCIGRLYLKLKDYAEAEKWFRLAAAKGHYAAKYALASPEFRFLQSAR